MTPTEKALMTGTLTDEEINSLSDGELISLASSMKRHADFDENQVDFKHAMHLVRLLRMGYEALTEGVIKVRRPDAQELLSIRAGAWTYEEVVEYADYMKNEVDKAIQTSHLKDNVNQVWVAKLVMDIQNSVW